MPIRPDQRDRYPADWLAISRRIRHERALDRCECDGRCGVPHAGDELEGLLDGRCGNHNRDDVIGARGQSYRIVLTVAHLDHTPEHCHDDNLLAMCQPCHLRYDLPHHAETRAATRAAHLAAAGQGTL